MVSHGSKSQRVKFLKGGGETIEAHPPTQIEGLKPERRAPERDHEWAYQTFDPFTDTSSGDIESVVIGEEREEEDVYPRDAMV